MVTDGTAVHGSFVILKAKVDCCLCLLYVKLKSAIQMVEVLARIDLQGLFKPMHFLLKQINFVLWRLNDHFDNVNAIVLLSSLDCDLD